MDTHWYLISFSEYSVFECLQRSRVAVDSSRVLVDCPSHRYNRASAIIIILRKSDLRMSVLFYLSLSLTIYLSLSVYLSLSLRLLLAVFVLTVPFRFNTIPLSSQLSVCMSDCVYTCVQGVCLQVSLVKPDLSEWHCFADPPAQNCLCWRISLHVCLPDCSTQLYVCMYVSLPFCLLSSLFEYYACLVSFEKQPLKEKTFLPNGRWSLHHLDFVVADHRRGESNSADLHKT